MSYEGYSQLLCLNGHLFHCNNIYNYDDTSDKKCPTCGAQVIFENDVDQTNNPRDGYIDFEKHFLIEKAFGKMCDMGHWHQTEPAKYRIPTKEEVESFREYACDHSGTHNCKQSGLHETCDEENNA
jgi:endogenous inhibitor of DNA gyrase (YacG/DUF329 family)